MEEVLWTRGQAAQLQLQLRPVLTGIDGQPHESSDCSGARKTRQRYGLNPPILVEGIREIIFIIKSVLS
jgi:hypothetical protein